YGSKPRKRARLIACASRRCFLADTAVMRLGTILPRSETKRCSSFTSLKSIFGALAPENGQVLRRRKKGRRAPPRPPPPLAGAVVFIELLLRRPAGHARPRRAAGRGAGGRHGRGRGSGRRARARCPRGHDGGSAASPRDLPLARRRGSSGSAAHPR